MQISHWFLHVETQPEVGPETYDAGAAVRADFFKDGIASCLADSDLDPAGAAIIRACLEDADLSLYEKLIRPVS